MLTPPVNGASPGRYKFVNVIASFIGSNFETASTQKAVNSRSNFGFFYITAYLHVFVKTAAYGIFQIDFKCVN